MAHLAKVFAFWRGRPAKALQIQAQTGKLMLHFAAKAGRDSIIAGWVRWVWLKCRL
jgi:hypothetical protein